MGSIPLDLHTIITNLRDVVPYCATNSAKSHLWELDHIVKMMQGAEPWLPNEQDDAYASVYFDGVMQARTQVDRR